MDSLEQNESNEQKTEIDEERQGKAREYAKIKHKLFLVDIVIGFLYIVVILGSGFEYKLKSFVERTPSWQPVSGWAPVHAGLYFLIMIIIFMLLTSPLSFYSGYILPHRYGLSTQSIGAWGVDLIKGLLISFIFEILAVEVVYLLLAATPDFWWLLVGIVFLLFTVILTNLAPVLILPLFFKLTPLEDEKLRDRLLALARQTGTRVKGVYVMNLSSKTTAGNAALMGIGNTRRIVLGDTLVEQYSPDEIEVVLAHELGHQVHNDIWKLMLSESLLILVGLYIVNLSLHWSVSGLQAYQSLSDIAAMPVIGLALGIFQLITMPVTNLLSRTAERAADQFAMDTTNKPRAFIAAMEKLANQNLAELDPGPVIEFLLYDHPAIGKRIRHAKAFAAGKA